VSRPVRDECRLCKRDLTLSGSRVCSRCVPDAFAPGVVVDSLCDDCFDGQHNNLPGAVCVRQAR
jgi:hypothetical protein